jgi:predicted DNA-binding transcriptional regulator AlpA
MATEMTVRLVDKEQVARTLGIGRREMGEMLDRPGFPRALGYYRGRYVWDEDAVESWVSAPDRPAAASDR